MKRRRYANGDLIQVTLSGGYRYIQLVGKNKQGIDVFRVLRTRTEAPANPDTLSDRATAYWLLSARQILVGDDRFVFIGNSDDAGEIPTLRRRFIGGWVVVSGDAEQFVKVPIGDNLAGFSIEEALPAQEIIDRLETEWLPHDDRSDIGSQIRTYKQKAKTLGLETQRETTFFAEFKSTRDASNANAELASRGLQVEYKRGSKSLSVVREWKAGETLTTMDVVDVELSLMLKEFDGEITGRETSA